MITTTDENLRHFCFVVVHDHHLIVISVLRVYVLLLIAFLLLNCSIQKLDMDKLVEFSNLW